MEQLSQNPLAEKRINNIDTLWNESLKNIVNYNSSIGSDYIRQKDQTNREQYINDDTGYLCSNMNNDLPIRDYEDRRISVGSEDFLRKAMTNFPQLKEIYAEALEYRIQNNMSYQIPIGVALDIATSYSGLRWSNKDLAQAINETLSSEQRKEEFSYILKNYIRPETHTVRYDAIANILKERRIGIDQETVMLDIGSSSGLALKPLNETEFPRLKIIALDRMPTRLLDRYYPLEEQQQNTERKMGDALNLDIPDDSIDVINLSYIFLHLTEDKCKQILSEAFRTLKVEGVMFIQSLQKGEYGKTDPGSRPDNGYRPASYSSNNRGGSDFDGIMLQKKDENTLEEIFYYGRQII